MDKIGFMALGLSVIAFIFGLSGVVLPASVPYGDNNYVLTTDRWHLPYHFMHYTLSSYLTLSENRIYAIPFYFPRSMKITKIGYSILNDDSMLNDGYARIGLYNHSNCYPSNLIEGSSAITVQWGANIDVILTFTNAQNLSGLYFGALLLSDDVDLWQGPQTYTSHPRDTYRGTSSLIQSGGYQPLTFYKTQTYGALPDPFPSGATATHQNCLAMQIYVTEML